MFVGIAVLDHVAKAEVRWVGDCGRHLGPAQAIGARPVSLTFEELSVTHCLEMMRKSRAATASSGESFLVALSHHERRLCFSLIVALRDSLEEFN